MNIVDSSGWLAYFADEPNAKHFLTPLCDSDLLVVPVITIYEVFKVILREVSENEALQAVVAMQKGRVVDLSTPLAIAASRLSGNSAETCRATGTRRQVIPEQEGTLLSTENCQVNK